MRKKGSENLIFEEYIEGIRCLSNKLLQGRTCSGKHSKKSKIAKSYQREVAVESHGRPRSERTQHKEEKISNLCACRRAFMCVCARIDE